MREGSGMVEFFVNSPDRWRDVAIARAACAVTFAAGLAIGGYKPRLAIYSTFLQRAPIRSSLTSLSETAGHVAPSIRATVSLARMDRYRALRLSYLRCIPDMVIMTPSDENECRQMLFTGYHYNDGPTAVHLSATARRAWR